MRACAKIDVMSKKSANNILSHLVGNDADILGSKECLCLSCLRRFSARDVTDWCDIRGKNTALCPECGMPYVLGDAVSPLPSEAEAKKLSDNLFQGDHFDAIPEDYYRFLDYYGDNKITHSPQNEALYVKYLKRLVDKDNSLTAFHALGDYYEFGTEFTKPSYDKALKFFLSKEFDSDGIALYRAGEIYAHKKDYQNAYICYSKAMVAKCPFGFLGMIDCNANGWFVPKDMGFALNAALDHFEFYLHDFVVSGGRDRSILPNISLRLSSFFLEGKAVERNLHLAEIFLLISHYSFSLLERDRNIPRFHLQEKDIADEALSAFMKEVKNPMNDILFDAPTFQDSLINNIAIPFVYEGNARIVEAAFNPFDHTFEFTIEYPYAPLIIDCGNGICRFEEKKIHWRFEGVKEATFSLNKPFEFVDGDLDSSYEFIHRDGRGQNVVASIVFDDEEEGDVDRDEEKIERKESLA